MASETREEVFLPAGAGGASWLPDPVRGRCSLSDSRMEKGGFLEVEVDVAAVVVVVVGRRGESMLDMWTPLSLTPAEGLYADALAGVAPGPPKGELKFVEALRTGVWKAFPPTAADLFGVDLIPNMALKSPAILPPLFNALDGFNGVCAVGAFSPPATLAAALALTVAAMILRNSLA